MPYFESISRCSFKNFFLPTSFRILHLSTSFRELSGVFLKKVRKNIFRIIRYSRVGEIKKKKQIVEIFLLPTSSRDFRLPTSFQEACTSFLKRMKKISSLLYNILEFESIWKKSKLVFLDPHRNMKPLGVLTPKKLFDAINVHTQAINLPKLWAILRNKKYPPDHHTSHDQWGWGVKDVIKLAYSKPSTDVSEISEGGGGGWLFQISNT